MFILKKKKKIAPFKTSGFFFFKDGFRMLKETGPLFKKLVEKLGP